jgi:signal transduction histidine kinase
MPAADPSRTSLHVSHHMTQSVQSVETGTRLGAVARLLASHRISCAVVIDRGRVVGIVSERDVVRMVSEDPGGWAARTAGEVMSQPVFVTTPAATVVEASAELSRRGIRRLPVVAEDGALCGIVTQTDLLRASKERLEEYAAGLERLVAERTAALVASTEQRTVLVDLTVHDIKNWLNAVNASLELVAEDPTEVEEILPLVRQSVSRITNLVRTLLDINRFEIGAMPARFREIPWSELSGLVTAEVGVMARMKAITLVQTGEARLRACCDPELVERIMLNLLDNAISAAPKGSAIDMHAEHRADGALVVRIGNRGPTIPSEAIAGLFRRHGQLESGSLQRFGGWGLGLTFCRLAVDHHGGQIRAISPYVDDEGAAFEFVLPARPAVRPATSATVAAAQP